MNIKTEILDGDQDTQSLHFDVEVTKEMVKFIENFKGVSWVPITNRYEVLVYIGKAFDAETVILNLQAELIKRFG